MRWIRSLPIVGLLMLTGAMLGTTARAQEIDAHGTFVLPYQVQWQKGTLPAGKYSFIVESGSEWNTSLVFVRGPRGIRGRLIAAPISTTDFSGESSLVIDTVNGKRYVRSLRLEPMKMELEYSVPKAKGQSLRAAVANTVPVRIVGE